MTDVGHKGRILVVDDELMLARVLAGYAERLGCEADSASDGSMALLMASQKHYDVVVTDLNMPNLNGHELMAALGRLPGAPRVIVITGHATLDAAIECLRRGASDFLVKPFETEEFLESLSKALARGISSEFKEPDWESVEEKYSLTRRQMEILTAFYRTGKSNQDLADELFLSPHTVKSHLRAAFDKLGVDNRAQLIRVLRF